MLEQLFNLYWMYDSWYLTREKLNLETRVWLEQHSADADDFAFALGCSLLAYTEPAGFY